MPRWLAATAYSLLTLAHVLPAAAAPSSHASSRPFGNGWLKTAGAVPVPGRKAHPARAAADPPAARHCPSYDTLVFQGGGVRGAAYAAVGRALAESGRLAGLRKVAGTSAGASAAALLAVGYTPAEFYEATVSADLSGLIESPPTPAPGWLLAEWPAVLGAGRAASTLVARWSALVRKFGLFSGGPIAESLDLLIAHKLCATERRLPLADVPVEWLQQPGGRCAGGKQGTHNPRGGVHARSSRLSQPVVSDVVDGFRAAQHDPWRAGQVPRRGWAAGPARAFSGGARPLRRLQDQVPQRTY